MRARAGAIDLLEHLEDALQLIRRNADAAVDDPHEGLVALDGGLDPDRGARG